MQPAFRFSRARCSFSHLALAVGILPLLWAAPLEALPDDILRDLQRDEFRVRENAQERLLRWARQDVPARAKLLLTSAKEAPDPEVRQRSHNVLHALAMEAYLQEGEGFVGIQMVAVRARVPGEGEDARELITITRVLRDTPAREAGLRPGDMIASVDGIDLAEDDALPSFQEMIKEMKPGKPTRFGIVRDGELLEIEVILGRRPPEAAEHMLGHPMADMNELARQDRDRFFREWLENLEK